MNLDAVNEALTWQENMECRTCGGMVHFEAKLVLRGTVIDVSANCHGMWSMFRVGAGFSDEDFFYWLSCCSRIPEKVPEYCVDYGLPAVSEHRRFHVSERTARAARIGSDMQIEGVRGMVHGIDTGRYEITLGPPL
jgi:hypothetical protein